MVEEKVVLCLKWGLGNHELTCDNALQQVPQ